MQPETVITFIDAQGKEHNALLIEEDQLHPGFVVLAYVDGYIAKRLLSVPHESHPSKDESNPDLPRIALNCWREGYAAGNVHGVFVAEGDVLPEFITAPFKKQIADLEEVNARITSERDALNVELAALARPKPDSDEQATAESTTSA